MRSDEANRNLRSGSYFRCEEERRVLDDSLNRKKSRADYWFDFFYLKIRTLLQLITVPLSPAGSAFHLGSLFRSSGDGNGGVGQLVDHRGPLRL